MQRVIIAPGEQGPDFQRELVAVEAPAQHGLPALLRDEYLGGQDMVLADLEAPRRPGFGIE
jgi:hypothetical protein